MIVGLSGKARSGKGAVASRLTGMHGFVEAAFADKLKSCCKAIFRLTDNQLYGDAKDIEDSFWEDTPRNILQKVGTECLRMGYRGDVWIKALEREIHANPGVNFVVSDCRFPNELEAIKAWGGKLVRIERPGGPQIETGQHASEVASDAWTAWDYAIVNGSTLPVLYQSVDTMMSVMRGSL